MKDQRLFLWITLSLCHIITIYANQTVQGKDSSTTCQTDVCDSDSPGLRCPPNTSIHVNRMFCSDVTTECAWGRYANLYSLCEGSNSCDASGLRMLFKSSCGARDVKKRKVLVQYFCVSDNQMYSLCSATKPKRVRGDFGMIRFSSSSRARVCRWWVPSVREQKNKLVVHMVSTYTNEAQCDGTPLKIVYMDCQSRDSVTKTYCNMEKVRDELIACGPVHVIGQTQKGQSGSFLLSYEVHIGSYAATDVVPSSNLAQCLPPPVLPPSSHSTTTTAPKSQAQEKSDGGNRKISTSSIFDPKLLFLYIALGILILVLLTALIVVIVSYRRLPKSNHRNGDSSERISLWNQNDDTPMDTFGHNSLVDPPAAMTSEMANGIKRGNTSDEIIATVHQDPAENDLDFDPRLSTTSGISTFLSDKRDSGFKDLIKTLQTGSFGMYSTVPDNHGKTNDPSWHDYYELPENGAPSDIYHSIDPDLRHYPHESSKSPIISHNAVEPQNHAGTHPNKQPLVTGGGPHVNDDYHYSVNDDEYALVRKSKKPPFSDNFVDVQPVQPSSRPESSPYQIETVDFRPASGPYEKRNSHKNELPDSAIRWSKGKKWMDEV